MKIVFQKTIYALCLTALSTVFALVEAYPETHPDRVSVDDLSKGQTVAVETTQLLLSLLDATPVADFL